MKKTLKASQHTITISGAPPSWTLEKLSIRLIEALRNAGWVSRKATIILSVSCVSAVEMKKLNRQFRGKNKPTDVLSFEQKAKCPIPGVMFLGDLVLCREVVRSQAKNLGHGVRDELAVLLAHGMLHLLGYDHEKSRKDATLMLNAEVKLLKLAKLGRKPGLILRTNSCHFS